ncbi:MAG: hypothetical protein RR506_06515 [Akkermansia sp.]
MSVYQSNVAAKAKPRLMSDGLTDPSFVCAGLYVTQAEVSLPANVKPGDTITLTQDMPEGWAVIPQLSSITKVGPVSTEMTVVVGDATDEDRYSTALDIAAAATTPVKMEFVRGVDAITPAKCTNSPIVAKIVSASDTNECKLTVTLAFSAM